MEAVAAGTRKVLITSAPAELGGVLVGVEDSGPGLAPDNLERVFDPFYTTKSGGLGMGLSICRSIIEAHAGRMWVTANPPPGGANFRFTVPPRSGSASWLQCRDSQVRPRGSERLSRAPASSRNRFGSCPA
jgi:signal transduction histidine kinase